jgi:putative transposase
MDSPRAVRLDIVARPQEYLLKPPSTSSIGLSMSRNEEPRPIRRHPAHGVLSRGSARPIVFLTVCTRHRSPFLANAEAHAALAKIWRDETAWLVGRYVQMPDHLHLFAAPSTEAIALDAWVRYWKSHFTKHHRAAHGPRRVWQTDHWDRRLRSSDSYQEKWEYVRNNPVRKGLAAHADEWPYEGVIHELRWD